MADSSGEDDIPDLESVSSSEYVEDSEDEMNSKREVKNKSLPFVAEPSTFNFSVAKQWLSTSLASLKKQYDTVVVYTLSPFLFGSTNELIEQTPNYRKWMGWCLEANLFHRSDYNVETFSIKELKMINIVDFALNWCRQYVVDTADCNRLASMFSLLEELRTEDDLSGALFVARKRLWFSKMVEDSTFEDDKLEMACLYTIWQVAGTISHSIAESHNLVQGFQNLEQENQELGVSMREEAEMKFLLGEKKASWNEIYRRAVAVCPYNHHLYFSRLQCQIFRKDPDGIVSDSLRMTYLKPDIKKPYLYAVRYLVELKEHIELAMRVRRRYFRLFPTPSDKSRMAKFLQESSDKKPEQIIRLEPSKSAQLQKTSILDRCKKATAEYRQGNYTTAEAYYRESLIDCKNKLEWRTSYNWKDRAWFLTSLQYAYASMLQQQDKLEEALREFRPICQPHPLLVFPPAHYGVANVLIKLKRHTEAQEAIEQGMTLIPRYHPEYLMHWPGTNDPITECLPSNTKMWLQQLKKKLEPVFAPSVAVCRYTNCLQHHITTSITPEAGVYRGHTLLTCTEKCSIGFHCVCWKRYKTTEEMNNNKDILKLACLTPDCPGSVDSITILEPSKKPKTFRADVPELKSSVEEPEPKVPAVTSSAKDTKELLMRKRKEKLAKAELESDKDEVVNAEDLVSQNKTASPTQQQHPKVTEDTRKDDEILAVINKRAEEEEELKGAKISKAKMKRKKMKEEFDQQNGCQWSDFFQLPEREGMVGESSCFEDKVAWQPNPETPFDPASVPETLREQVNKFETMEVPSMGLTPRLLPATAAAQQSDIAPAAHVEPQQSPPSEQSADPKPPPPPPAASNSDWLVSYFQEIFKEHAVLELDSPILTASLQPLPEENKTFLASYGGLSKFLLSTDIFETVPGTNLIGLKNPLAGENLTASSSSASDSFPTLADSMKEDPAKSSKQQQPVKAGQSKKGRHSAKGGSVKEHSDTRSVSSSAPVSASSSMGSSPTYSPVAPRKDIDLDPISSFTTKLKEAAAEQTDGKSLKLRMKLSKDKLTMDNGLEIPIIWRDVTDSLSDILDDEAVKTDTSKGVKKPLVADLQASPIVSAELSELKSKLAKKLPKPPADSVTTTPESGDAAAKPSQLPTSLKPSVGVGCDVKTVSVLVQTDKLLTVDRAVSADLIPPVESFKDRYKEVIKEKKSLQKKLESSEDRRVQLQNQHSLDLEKAMKKARHEVTQDMTQKLRDMEDKSKEEKEHLLREKRESTDQIKLLKSEMKTLTDKLARSKKDVQRKDKEKADAIAHHQQEMERAVKERKKIDERHKAMLEAKEKSQQRAAEAEVQLLTQKRDFVLRAWEQRFQDVERLCSFVTQNLPSGSEPELLQYRDNIKSMLERFKGSYEDHIQLVRNGREMQQLEAIGNPNIPLNQHLASRLPVLQRSMQQLFQTQQQPPRPAATSQPSSVMPPVAVTTMAPPHSASSNHAPLTTSAPQQPMDPFSMFALQSSQPPPSHPLQAFSQPHKAPPQPNQVPSQSHQGASQPHQGPPQPHQGALQSYPGLPQPHQGAPQSNQGPPQPHQGPPQPHQGPPQPHQGAPQSYPGLPQSHQGAPQSNQGPPQSNQGPPQPHQGAPQSYPGAPQSNQGPPQPHQGPPQPHQGPPQSLPPTQSHHPPSHHQPGPPVQPSMMYNPHGGFNYGSYGQMRPSGGMGAGPGPVNMPPQSQPKSSFQRMVNKLTPVYPTYSSHDFRLILRDVRSRNNNKLSGLSLDAIVQQMKDLIEARELEKPSVAAAAAATPTSMPSAIPAPLTMPSGLPSGPAIPPENVLQHHLGSGLPTSSGLSHASGFPNASGLPHSSSGNGLPNMSGLPRANSGSNLANAIGLPLGGGIPHTTSMSSMSRANSLPGVPHGSALTARGLSDSGLSAGRPSVMGPSALPGLPASMQSAIPGSGISQGGMPPTISAAQYFSQPGFPSFPNPRGMRSMPHPPHAAPPVHTDVEYCDDMSCIICYEDMEYLDSVRLECGHRFHTECIRSWLKEQSTCPTCRNHALLPDEYPLLGQ